MCHGVAQLFGIVEVTQQNFVIDCRSVLLWSEKVDRIQVGQIDSSRGDNDNEQNHQSSISVTNLVFGTGHSEPYSWTCIPKKHTSVPSITSKANKALARYGNVSGHPHFSTYLRREKIEH